MKTYLSSNNNEKVTLRDTYANKWTSFVRFRPDVNFIHQGNQYTNTRLMVLEVPDRWRLLLRSTQFLSNLTFLVDLGPFSSYGDLQGSSGFCGTFDNLNWHQIGVVGGTRQVEASIKLIKFQVKLKIWEIWVRSRVMEIFTTLRDCLGLLTIQIDTRSVVLEVPDRWRLLLNQSNFKSTWKFERFSPISSYGDLQDSSGLFGTLNNWNWHQIDGVGGTRQVEASFQFNLSAICSLQKFDIWKLFSIFVDP